jgi:hypothetical protein
MEIHNTIKKNNLSVSEVSLLLKIITFANILLLNYSTYVRRHQLRPKPKPVHLWEFIDSKVRTPSFHDCRRKLTFETGGHPEFLTRGGANPEAMYKLCLILSTML